MIGSFLPQPMKQGSLNYQNLLQLLWKRFLCRLLFQMIEINYVPIYMKINHIFSVIKGQFPAMDYIPNTIILYFIVHCIYVLNSVQKLCGTSFSQFLLLYVILGPIAVRKLLV